jgi:transcriptional regulator with XRE-family HTH domain
MHTFNPANVVALRQKRRWSLDRLAEESKVNRQTIHRIEKGKVTPHMRTIEALARALGSTPTELCGPTLQVQPASTLETAGKSQMNVRLSGTARNALSLVAIRYGIKASLVLEAAPLLFHCAAELSLKLRQQKLDSFKERLQELRQEGLDHVPLRGLDFWETDAALDREQQSIDAKDVFGALTHESDQMSDYYGTAIVNGENNPLRNYLAALAEEAGGAEVSSFYSEWGLDYELGRDDVLKHMSGNEEAADHILEGRVLLHEIPKALWAGTQREERARWVLERGEEWLKEHPPMDFSTLKLDDLLGGKSANEETK